MLADTYTIRLAILQSAGEHEALLVTAQDALRLSQSIGNTVHQSMALLMMGETHYLQGRLGQALSDFEAAIAISEATGDDLSSQGIHASMVPVYLDAGWLEQAEQWADKLYAARDNLMPVFRTVFLANTARTKIALGELQGAETILEQTGMDFDQGAPPSASTAAAFAADGHLQLAKRNPSRCLDRMTGVIQRLQQAGSRHFLAEMLWLQGRACLALERGEQAEAALMEAKAVADDTGERIVMWQILAVLSEIERRNGNQPEAKRLGCQAQEIICYIADNAGSNTLRDSFLGQPAVARVLTEP